MTNNPAVNNVKFKTVEAKIDERRRFLSIVVEKASFKTGRKNADLNLPSKHLS